MTDWPTEDELRDASARAKLAPIQQRLDALIDELPWPVRHLVRWWARHGRRDADITKGR